MNASTRVMAVRARYKVSEYAIAMRRDGTLIPRPGADFPLLENEGAWDAWKMSMSHHLTEDGVSNQAWLKNAAIYLFCKLNM